MNAVLQMQSSLVRVCALHACTSSYGFACVCVFMCQSHNGQLAVQKMLPVQHPVLLPTHALLSPLLPAVPAQPTRFEAEAELDTRIMLTWLWPVQDQIIKYELQYSEAGSDNKVRILTWKFEELYDLHFSLVSLCLPVCLFIYLSICLSVCISLFLSVLFYLSFKVIECFFCVC